MPSPTDLPDEEDLDVALTGVLTFRELAASLSVVADMIGAEDFGFVRLPRPIVGELGQRGLEAIKSKALGWTKLNATPIIAPSPDLLVARVSAIAFAGRGFAAAVFSATHFAPAAAERLQGVIAKLTATHQRVSRFESLISHNLGLTALIEQRLGACAALATPDGDILWSSQSARALIGSEGESMLSTRVSQAVKDLIKTAEPQKIMLQLPGKRRVFGALSFISETPNSSVRYVAIELFGSDVETHADAYKFTPAEREIYDLLKQGLSYSQAAKARNVSLDTVRTQVKAVFRKAGVSSRFALIAKGHGSDA